MALSVLIISSDRMTSWGLSTVMALAEVDAAAELEAVQEGYHELRVRTILAERTSLRVGVKSLRLSCRAE